MPLGLTTPAEEQALIEKIVIYWKGLNSYDLEGLYDLSKLDDNSVWYYDKVANSTM
jgi:hypothetical protein